MGWGGAIHYFHQGWNEWAPLPVRARIKSAHLRVWIKKWSFVCAWTYPHPPVWCVRARCRDPRAGRAGRSPGGARSRGCDRTGIPAGGRTWTPRRRRARRAGEVRRRATRGPGNGCGTGRARAAGVRGSRGRRTPRRQIWTDPAELKCLI